MRRLIKFEKDDCNPCAMVSAILDKKGIQYDKINPFNDPEMAMKYKVRSVPTVILVNGEEEVKRSVGFNPEELEEIITMI